MRFIFRKKTNMKPKNQSREKEPYKSFDYLRKVIQEAEENFIGQEVLQNKKRQAEVARDANRTRERISQIIAKVKKRFNVK